MHLENLTAFTHAVSYFWKLTVELFRIVPETYSIPQLTNTEINECAALVKLLKIADHSIHMEDEPSELSCSAVVHTEGLCVPSAHCERTCTINGIISRTATLLELMRNRCDM